ncbi:MAG TPA: hypothetical protein VJ505_01955 [Holophagaceae bacterium]|nr:hypothetical protein [Holophagaceae bacterium]
MKRPILILLSAVGIWAQPAPEPAVPEVKNRFGITLFNANQQNGSSGYHAVLPYFGGSLQWDDTYTSRDARITNFRFEYMRTLRAKVALGISYAQQLDQDFPMEITQQVGGPTARLDTIHTSYRYRASGLGLALYFQSAVTLGLGLDQKSESASFPTASNVVNGTGSTITGQKADFSRLWSRLVLGKRFDFQHVSPYLGIEYAKPLSSTDADASAPTTNWAKVLAPKSQLGFVVGLSF